MGMYYFRADPSLTTPLRAFIVRLVTNSKKETGFIHPELHKLTKKLEARPPEAIIKLNQNNIDSLYWLIAEYTADIYNETDCKGGLALLNILKSNARRRPIIPTALITGAKDRALQVLDKLLIYLSNNHKRFLPESPWIPAIAFKEANLGTFAKGDWSPDGTNGSLTLCLTYLLKWHGRVAVYHNISMYNDSGKVIGLLELRTYDQLACAYLASSLYELIAGYASHKRETNILPKRNYFVSTLTEYGIRAI